MKMKGSRGSILIMVLWILSILVLLSIGVGYTMSLDQKLIGYQKDRLIALHLAKAGVQQAIAELLEDPTPDVDAPVDSWFNNPEIFKEIGLNQGSYTVSFSVQEGDQADKTVYGIMDEDRKININIASKEVLTRLPGVTNEMADSILDWRDEDPFPNLLGAEDFYYRTLELPYTAKNGPFEVLEEVLMVRGMTQEVFQSIRPFVTIYSDGKVNLNTAPKEVMMALGMSEGLSEKILRFRRRNESFMSLGSAEQQLNAFESLLPQEAVELTNLVAQSLLKTNAHVFRIAVQGKVRQGKIIRSVEAVVKRDAGSEEDKNPSAILLSWREY